ncbi:MAG TPA: carboxypeptidase regulatory-like domain-containing protein [Polyangiaceae bacterium]
MKWSRLLVGILATSSAGFAAFGIACGSSDDSTFGDGVDGSTGGGGGDQDATTNPPNDSGGFQGGDSGGSHGCVNLQCKQVKCDGGGTTTITGKVYDPAGINPLYDALVYIPNGTPDAIDDDAGVTCDRCGVTASGSPLVSAISGSDGSFTLTNVPVGVDLPLVVQVGKWRRIVTIPAANACTDNPLTDVDKTRLPRNSAEGHIPKMAIATGNADPFECLLRKIGIDDAEFSAPGGGGRIQMFKGGGGVDLADASAPDYSTLWGDIDTMKAFDIVMLPCESSTRDDLKTDAGRANFSDYVDVGGRAFVTHYSYTWLEKAPQPMPLVATWQHNENDRSDKKNASPTLIASIDRTFPKGEAFAEWLSYTDASTGPDSGQLPIQDWRHDVKTENDASAQRWIQADTRSAWPDGGAPSGAGEVVQHFTFNTPIEAGVDDAGEPLQCGKVVFSDFHVSASERVGGKTFPSECKSGEMTPQEKALEFMLFDLSACVQNETEVPQPPPPR